MPVYARTVPVMERHRFDVASLDRYLRDHLAGYRGGLEVQQFDSGHSNPTFFLSAEMAGGKRQDFVLRKKPPGQLVASAHQVDREFRVISALGRDRRAGRARPSACTDDRVIGQMFYIMELRRGPHPARPVDARPDAGRARGDLQFDEPTCSPPAQGRPGEGRARRLRPQPASTSPASSRAGPSSTPSSRPSISRRWRGSSPGCPSTSPPRTRRPSPTATIASAT